MKKITVAVAAAFVLAAGAAGAADPTVNCRPFSPAVDRTTYPATYTVKEGDNLHLISTLFYDHARNWKAIWQANRGVIRNANRLSPGTTLTIPKP
jgi:nucleoid-associated protein YgaU